MSGLGPKGWPSNTGTHFLNPSTREAFRLSGEMRFHLSAKCSSSCLSAMSQSRFAGVAWNLLFANAKGCFVLKTDEYVHHNPRSWSTIPISANYNQLYNLSAAAVFFCFTPDGCCTGPFDPSDLCMAWKFRPIRSIWSLYGLKVSTLSKWSGQDNVGLGGCAWATPQKFKVTCQPFSCSGLFLLHTGWMLHRAIRSIWSLYGLKVSTCFSPATFILR